MIFGLLLGIEIGIFLVGLTWPIDTGTQQSLLQEANSITEIAKNPDPLTMLVTIFSNNVRVALLEMIPVFGALVLVLSMFTTGLLTQAIVASNGLPGSLGGILFLFPYTIVEFSAYMVAVGAGTMLLVGWRRRRLRREAEAFALEVVGVVIILLVAATMETMTIVSPLLGLALWIPTVLSLIWLVRTFRRSRA